MVNTDYFQDHNGHDDEHDDHDQTPYRTFGLGVGVRTDTRTSIRRVHR